VEKHDNKCDCRDTTLEVLVCWIVVIKECGMKNSWPMYYPSICLERRRKAIDRAQLS
jgi:hypothetical protein